MPKDIEQQIIPHQNSNLNRNKKPEKAAHCLQVLAHPTRLLILEAHDLDPARRDCPGCGSVYSGSGDVRFTSGRVHSKGKGEFQYGRIEARIKLPVGEGLWPAFWMLGADIDEVGWPQSGELDVMENLGYENWVSGAVHGPGYAGAESRGYTYTLPAGQKVDAWFP